MREKKKRRKDGIQYYFLGRIGLDKAEHVEIFGQNLACGARPPASDSCPAEVHERGQGPRESRAEGGRRGLGDAHAARRRRRGAAKKGAKFLGKYVIGKLH